MKIIWLGHGSCRIETGDLVLPTAPELTGINMIAPQVLQVIEI